MTPDFWQTLFPSTLGALGGALIAYTAIRMDIAVLKANLENLKERLQRNEEDTHEAHTRIDRVRRHEMDTR